ncbi:nitroreductase family protein [Phycicoccus sp. CSK15P-2]|uniref:nitroreductase family protein n=1 Tax=Phycicoccus sp. CSK15P-2 TaxID=2807627 RepID=UPI001950E7CB|nr:nitroreductase family protein [Phycicoccus sp. CSK15P-2]MBM6404001.1 nitroreductase family protein [Phycicoccus sp. CSK15P-2]
MELREVVRRRRMVRRFDPDVPVPAEVVDDLLSLAVRAPSAGFSQGWDFVVLLTPEERDRFWGVAAGPGPGDAWLRGVSAAPALVLCLSDPDAYLERYAEPDKGWTDRSLDRWPVPYWDTDTAMAAMLVLLGAEDAGLGALFFGVPPDRHDDVRAALGVPPGRRLVGVVALGHEAERVSGSARTRARRPLAEVVHHGRFGVSRRP